MIIGLCGKKQHGKDTVGGILVEEHGFERLSFADALKDSSAALLGLPREMLEAYKNDPDARVEFSVYGEEDFSESNPDCRRVHASLTLRQFWQRYGTEAHRDIFGENFWTDVIADQIESVVGSRGQFASRAKIVVTDVRFDNEAEVIRRFSGIVVEVYRPQVVDDGDAHASENLPRSDMMLWNGEGIEELRQRVAQCVREGWVNALL